MSCCPPVLVFIVVPLLAGVLLRSFLLRRNGMAWFEGVLLPKFAPVTIAVLLATPVPIYAFQTDNITDRFFHVVLIAVPITLQVYFNAGLAYGLMKWLKVEHSGQHRGRSSALPISLNWRLPRPLHFLAIFRRVRDQIREYLKSFPEGKTA